MNERLRAYTSFDQDRLIQIDRTYAISRTIMQAQEAINRGGHIVFFDLPTDRSLIVDKVTAKIISGIGIGLYNECMALDLDQEVKAIEQHKRSL